MGNENTTKSYVPFTPIVGEKVGDDSYLFSSKDVMNLNNTLYALTKMVHGNLNLANLNKETNDVFTGMVTFTDLSDPTKSTVINGNHITTGTISADRVSGGTLEGVTVISSSGTGSHGVELTNGGVYFVRSGGGYPGFIFFDGDDSKLKLETLEFVPLKISTGDNMSIDAGAGYGIYIGVSNNGETIEIGSSTQQSTLTARCITMEHHYKGVHKWQIE